MTKKVQKEMIIIGAGIAGLATGCYGQMNGYKTTIFEAHDLPGGVCTAWKRKGYTFDGCIHWLVGSGPRNAYYRMWEELGAVQNRGFVHKDGLYRVEGPKGEAFELSSDPQRLEEQMLALSPKDEAVVKEFTGAIRRFTKIKLPLKAMEVMSPVDGIRTLLGVWPSMTDFKRFGKMSLQEFAEGLHHPFLRHAMLTFFDMPDFPMIAVIATLAWMHQRVAGFPLGGSLAFSQAIAERYLQLGGVIHYNHRVEKIIVEEDHAVGVELADGREFRSDILVSAADGYNTIYRMLDGKYTNDSINGLYAKRQIFDPLIQISLGVRREMRDEPHVLIYPLNQPILIEGSPIKEIGVKNYGFDPSLSPKGGTSLVVLLKADYDYWKSVGEDSVRYQEEKQRVLEQVIRALEERYPGIRSDIEVADVATPLTYERYTGNWRGSFEGWLITTENNGKTYDRSLPGLKDFYMAGQWIVPGGGIPTAAKCGRDLLQILCKQEKRRFVTSIPTGACVDASIMA